MVAKTKFLLWIAGLCSGFVSLSCSMSQPESPSPADLRSSEANQVFKSLFNGQDLKGWHTNREKIGHGTGGRWTVEGGMIVGEQNLPTGEWQWGYLAHRRDLRRF